MTPRTAGWTRHGLTRRQTFGRNFLEVDPGVLTLLTREAMRDIAHLLRPGHLRQLRSITRDPEASPNDRYVALDLLKNACIAAGGVLPMCQDTGTAIVMGKRGQHVLTDGRDEEHIARGVYDAYTQLNLRYSQLAPLTMWDERNTGSNLPAQIEMYATGGRRVQVPVHGQGRRLGQQVVPVPADQGGAERGQHAALPGGEDPRAGHRGLPALSPGHRGRRDQRRVRAEDRQVRVGALPGHAAGGRVGGRARVQGHELEQQVLEITRQVGIGAQFGGKYFCHDVRVIRLPRHGASCPVAIAVSCSADRQALGKITADGVFLERLETDPARFLPETDDAELADDVVRIDLNRPMDEIRAELSKYPVATRLSLTGPMVVARDIAHAKIADGWRRASRCRLPVRSRRLLRGPAKTPEGYASGSFGPTTAGRMDSYVDSFQAAGGSLVMLAKGNRSAAVTAAASGTAGSTWAPSAGRPPGWPGTASPAWRCWSTPSSAWRRSGGSRSATSPRSSSWTTRATTSSPT